VQGCQYSCVVATPERAMFVAGSDRKVKELEDSDSAGMQILREVETGCVITQLAIAAGAEPRTGRMISRLGVALDELQDTSEAVSSQVG
jgi:hypothetical protein